MILLIDTSREEKLILTIFKSTGRKIKKTSKARLKHSETLLKSLNKVLTENKLKLKNIRGIIAINGPGKFTALRAGVNLANTLAFALNVPVIGYLSDKFSRLDEYYSLFLEDSKKQVYTYPLEPVYGKNPNITGACY